MSSSRANRRGMFALVAGTAAFSANDTLVKLSAKTYPVGEIIVVRGLFVMLLAGSMVLAFGYLSAIRTAANRHVVVRSSLDAAAALLFTAALVHMPMAELAAITLASPLIITALAVVILSEEVGWRRWTAIIIGFVGTLCVVKPTPAAFDAWALLGLGCALVSASRDLVTRYIDPAVPTIVVAFTTAVVVTLAGCMLGLSEEWRPIAPGDLGIIFVSAGFLAVGNFLTVLAFRRADVAAVAPFRYTVLLWAGINGYIVFGEIPDRFAILGAVLIVGSGLYALHREVVRRRALTTPLSPAE